MHVDLGLVFVVVVLGFFLILTAWIAPDVAADLRQLLGGVARRYSQGRRAEQRAELLLRGVLSPAEYARLQDRGYLEVHSPRYPHRVYRVPRDGGIVIVREGGRAIGGLCLQSVEPIPAADAVAMHKLMIEGAEREYLQRANHLSVGAISRYGLGGLYER